MPELELHRLRIDTVDEGIRHLDALLDALERLQELESTFSQLDEAHATALWAEEELESPEHEAIPDFDAARAHFGSIRENLENVIKHTTEDGFAHEYALNDMHHRLKMLRQWLNEAQLDYETTQS